MGSATCLQPLQVVQQNLPEEKVAEPFPDNFLYLEMLTDEVFLWLAAAYMKLRNIEKISEEDAFLSGFSCLGSIADRTALDVETERMAMQRQAMEEGAAEHGIRLNFNELVGEYGLDDFERKILQLLFVADINTEFATVVDCSDLESWKSGFGRGTMEVGVILSMLCQDCREQFACRACFSIDRPLVKYEIIELSGHFSGFLTLDVKLNDRISRFCMDDHNVYDTDLLCITSERPTVKLSQVIIDKKVKEDLVHYTESFIENSKNGRGLGESFGYGAGLTCLFFGLSGTGKTMLAHGLANHLGCRLFSINIGGLQNEDLSFEDAMKHIFREARLANGIVFLDECDDLLTDASYMSRSFLIEIEKAECITILATNKTISLDPALDRRISLKVSFGLPGENERLAIWEALIPEGMCYGEDVDLSLLASKYQFTGGLIKNSLLMAAGNAVVRQQGGEGDVCVGVEDIHKAAGHQAKSMFELIAIGKVSTPLTRLEDLDIRSAEVNRVAEIAAIVPDMLSEKQGFCGLICSENIQIGVDCAEAVAAENGLMVRQFSLAELLTDSHSSERNVEKITDPFTQQQMSVLEYVFTKRPGQQEVLLLVDDSYLLKDFLEDENTPVQSQDWLKFKGLLRDFGSILFVVGRHVDESRVPIEFACHVQLSRPGEDAQIRVWQKHCPGLSDGEIVELVERYPMHSREISLVARQAGIAARLNGFAKVELSDITAMAKRLRGVRSTPVLFGGKR